MDILLACSLDRRNRTNITPPDISFLLDFKGLTDPYRKEYMWAKALNQLGHRVEVYFWDILGNTQPVRECIDKAEKWGVRGSSRIRQLVDKRTSTKMKKRFVQFVAGLKPDLVILSEPVAFFDSDTIAQIKKLTYTNVALMAGTSPVALISPDVLGAASLLDYIFCNNSFHQIQWFELGAKNVFVLPISACDPDIHRKIVLRPDEEDRFESDICFVGRLSPARTYRVRVELLRALCDLGLALWSDDYKLINSDPALKSCYRGEARGVNMVKALSATKIAVNVHGHTVQGGGNMRTFEAAAIGCFQLTDRCAPEWFVENKEIVLYSDVYDMKSKISYYLEHEQERQRIAASGQTRALRDHTYLDRMSHLIEIVADRS